jgi:hypothetical protein
VALGAVILWAAVDARPAVAMAIYLASNYLIFTLIGYAGYGAGPVAAWEWYLPAAGVAVLGACALWRLRGAGCTVTGGLARARKPAQVSAVFYWKRGGSGGGPPARAAPEEGTPAAAGAADATGTGQSPADDRNHRPGWLVP